MKLDLKYDSAYIATEVSRLLGVAPLLSALAAVLMMVIAVFAVRDFVQTLGQEKRFVELPQFSVKSAAVPPKLYADYAATLNRLSPVVNVSADKDSIRINISNAANFSEFMFVLSSVQGVADNVIWKADEICLMRCNGGVATAVIKGVTEQVEVQLRGNGND